MNKILVAIAVLAVSAVGAEANAAVTFKFSNPSGNLGVSHTYTVSGLSIIAKGFDQNNNPTALWGKNGGGNEDGLGLANDDTGDHEIEYLKGFVQLDVSGLFKKVVAGSTKFATNSTTQGEEWAVFGSNISGSYSAANQVAHGTTQLETILPFFGKWKYYDFAEIHKRKGDNFLIADVTTTRSVGVPEPATWAMMIVGFGLVGSVARSRRVAKA